VPPILRMLATNGHEFTRIKNEKKREYLGKVIKVKFHLHFSAFSLSS